MNLEAVPELNEPAPADLASLRDLRVLVVDDNATNRRILGQMVSSRGMVPTLVESGPDALEALRNGARNGTPYRVVLIDAHMPEMDGFALAEHIKADSLLTESLLVLLTSRGMRGDGARCRQLGVAAYLTKPAGEAELLEVILRVLGTRPQSNVELITRHTLHRVHNKLRVLVVDDNIVNRQLAIRLVEKQGYLTEAAGNGRAAVAALEKQSCDLVLMDIQMPEMDGIEATRAIRRNEMLTHRHIPIIAMTAHAIDGDRQRCLAAGMDDYVSKPISAPVLFATIENVLHRSREGNLASA